MSIFTKRNNKMYEDTLASPKLEGMFAYEHNHTLAVSELCDPIIQKNPSSGEKFQHNREMNQKQGSRIAYLPHYRCVLVDKLGVSKPHIAYSKFGPTA